MKNGGISLGGVLVIVGIVIAIFWSLILGIIVALVGLIAFGRLRPRPLVLTGSVSGREWPRTARSPAAARRGTPPRGSR